MAKTLSNGDRIEFQPVNRLLRVDGAPICQVLFNESDGQIWLRFMDTDKHRSTARGTRYIEVPLKVFVARIEDCS